jgi:hypothetical protein
MLLKKVSPKMSLATVNTQSIQKAEGLAKMNSVRFCVDMEKIFSSVETEPPQLKSNNREDWGKMMFDLFGKVQAEEDKE